MTQVLDLRKKPKTKVPIKEPEKVLKKDAPVVSPVPKSAPQISWEAPSFYFNPQKKYLTLLVIALGTAGAGMLFWSKDHLLAIFLLLSSLVLILYSNKRPETSKINIDQRGVVIGDNSYYYKDLKSFWIHYYPGDIKELSLESKKWYMSYIKVSIEDKNPLDIRSLLVNFLPEREHEHSLIDIISRRIGL